MTASSLQTTDASLPATASSSLQTTDASPLMTVSSSLQTTDASPLMTASSSLQTTDASLPATFLTVFASRRTGHYVSKLRLLQYHSFRVSMAIDLCFVQWPGGPRAI